MNENTTSGNTVKAEIQLPSHYLDSVVVRALPYVRNEEEFRKCVEIVISDIEDTNLYVGKHPKGMVGGAVYYVLSKLNIAGYGDVTQAEIADWAGVSPLTIRENERRIQNHRSSMKD